MRQTHEVWLDLAMSALMGGMSARDAILAASEVAREYGTRFNPVPTTPRKGGKVRR